MTARRQRPQQQIIIHRGFALFMALAACVGLPRLAAAQTIRRAPQANLAAPPARPIRPAPSVRAVDANRELVVTVDFEQLDALARSGGIIEVPLPDGNSARAAIEFSDFGSQTFLSGRLIDTAPGEITLTALGHVLSGRLVVGGRMFRIAVIADTTELHMVREVDPSPVLPESTPIEPPISPRAPGAAVARTSPDSGDAGDIVDVMILYTPKARWLDGGTRVIEADAVSAINDANLALAYSGLTQHFRLAYLGPVDYDEGEELSPVNLARLAGTDDGYMDEIHALRTAYGADVVALITTATDYCGLSYVMPPGAGAAFADSAFSVMYPGCLTTLTLPHEIGHNMGLRHDPANAGGTPALPYGYGYAVPGYARDLMAYECSPSCPRQTIYSTPLKNFMLTAALPAGTSTQDAARALNEMWSTVANFRAPASGPCSYAVNQTEVVAGRNGGTQILTLHAPPQCAWTASSTVSWILPPGPGSGIGNASLLVSGNSGGPRVGAVVIGGQTVIVRQAGAAPLPPLNDFDHDGRTDLTVYRPSTGEWYIRESHSQFSTYTSFQWGLPGDVPVRGDFDGDGQTDLCVWRPSTGEWYIRYSSLGYPPWWTPGGYSVFQWGLPGDVPLTGDFNGDGRSDLVVYRPSTFDWWVRLSTAPYDYSSSMMLERWSHYAGDVPIVSDFDGDRLSDPMFYTPAQAGHNTGQSEWNFTTAADFYNTRPSQRPVYLWGLPGDVPVVADFDGDGKMDITAYRPSTGEWFIRYSGRDYAPSEYGYFQWGLVGDIPVSGDFDGDGRTDISIYRPSTGEWYIRYSSLGFPPWWTPGAYGVFQWGLPGDVPVQ